MTGHRRRRTLVTWSSPRSLNAMNSIALFWFLGCSGRWSQLCFKLKKNTSSGPNESTRLISTWHTSCVCWVCMGLVGPYHWRGTTSGPGPATGSQIWHATGRLFCISTKANTLAGGKDCEELDPSHLARRNRKNDSPKWHCVVFRKAYDLSWIVVLG
jgi:hypothetical protein